MYLIDSLQERRAVENGQAWLDEHMPSWWARSHVLLTTLDVACEENCMLAQASDLTFTDAMEMFGLSGAELVQLGFLAPEGSCRETVYARLNHYWKEAIRARRAWQAHLKVRSPVARRISAPQALIQAA